MLGLILSKANIRLDRLQVIIHATLQRLERSLLSGPALVYQAFGWRLGHVL